MGVFFWKTDNKNSCESRRLKMPENSPNREVGARIPQKAINLIPLSVDSPMMIIFFLMINLLKNMAVVSSEDTTIRTTERTETTVEYFV